MNPSENEQVADEEAAHGHDSPIDGDAASRVERILAERARQLARPPPKVGDVAIVGLVVLQVGSECYGVEVTSVEGIYSTSGIAPVPGLATYWSGLMNIRGVLFPVLDLAEFLGLEDAADVERRRVAVIGRGPLRVGLLVDDVPEVRDVPLTDIGPTLSGVSDQARGLVRGVTEDMLAVVDVEALLSDQRLVVRDEIA